MRVFISHSFSDADLARRLAGRLRNGGLTVWDPGSDILPGDNPGEKVAQALEHSDAMVVLLTPVSLGSPYVEREIGFALGNRDYRNRLVSAIAGGVARDQIPWILRKLPTVDLGQDPGEEGLDRVVEALKAAA